MLKLLAWMLAVGALIAAAVLVPIGGETAWHRAEARGLPRAAAHAAKGAWRWTAGLFAPEPAQAKTQQIAKAPARKKPRKPAEKITRNDRASLDELVAHQGN